MTKLKLAFDPTGVWDREDYRNIIKQLVTNTTDFEVYLVTENTDADFISNVETQSGVDSDNVYSGIASDSAVVTQLDALGIQIYLSYDNPLITLVTDSSDDTVGILINDIVDNNKSQMKYITWLEFWVKRIMLEANGQARC